MHDDDPKLWSHEMLCERYQRTEAARMELVDRLKVLARDGDTQATRVFAAMAVGVGQAILSGLAEPRR